MSVTKRALLRRLYALLVLGVVFGGSLTLSYRAVHHDAVRLAHATAPALLAVDTAKNALLQAKEDTERGAAGSGDFQTRISVAHQSLALAAAENVTGREGRQTLQTVAGLTSVYTDWVQRAVAEPAGSPLRCAYLHYADNTLYGAPSRPDPDRKPGTCATEGTGRAGDSTSGIIGRLNDLRDRQAEVVDRQARHGASRGPVTLGWAVVLVSGAALLVVLLETQLYLRRRFKRRLNGWLLPATVLLVAGTAVLATLTRHTLGDLSAARDDLLRHQPTGDAIRRAGDEVAARLGGVALHDTLTVAVLAGALLLVGLTVRGLLPWLREYPTRPVVLSPRTRRGCAALACCALLLPGGLTTDAPAYRWHGSVTLLANWSGRDEALFRRTVIAPFEAEHRIHVIYQGSSAESQVLAADTQTGTAPDIVVLPGPGELAGYRARGQLRPLDDLIGDFDSILPRPDRKHVYWVPVKADVKSLVWHPQLSADALRTAAGRPGDWCLGMGSGATSGWPGTDWVEDILLQQAGPRAYEEWATGQAPWTHNPAVERAFTTWGRLVGAGGRYATRALGTDYTDAVDGGPRRLPCRLAHAGAYVRVTDDWRTAAFAPSATLVPGARQHDSWEVGSDLAAVLHDTPEARTFLTYLVSQPVQRRWNFAEHSFSASRRVPPDAYPATDPTARSIAGHLHDRSATRCWDASDAMPPRMRDAFTQAALEYLAHPDRLPELLATLEQVRRDTRRTSATGPTGPGARPEEPWLPSVCTH